MLFSKTSNLSFSIQWSEISQYCYKVWQGWMFPLLHTLLILYFLQFQIQLNKKWWGKRHNYLLQIQNLSWISNLLRISNGKIHSMMPSCRHPALFMFMHIYALHGISEKKQKQQTVLALREASTSGLNFGQLFKQIKQILNKLFFHLTLCTNWKAGSTTTGRHSKRMQEAPAKGQHDRKSF